MNPEDIECRSCGTKNPANSRRCQVCNRVLATGKLVTSTNSPLVEPSFFNGSGDHTAIPTMDTSDPEAVDHTTIPTMDASGPEAGDHTTTPTMDASDSQKESREKQPKGLNRRVLLTSGITVIGLTALGGTIWWLSRGQPSPLPTPTCVPTKTQIASDGLLTPGVLSWGADPTGGAPHVFLDANGAPIGFEVDIANVIAQLMGISQACYPTDYKWKIEKDLQSRKMDIILNGWEITPGRQQDEAFSIPYYRYSQQLVVRTNDPRFSPYTASSQITLAEVKQYKFGTGADYKAADLLRAVGITPIPSTIPLDELDKERVDIVMVDTPIVAYYVQGKGKGAVPSHTLSPIGKPLFADSTSNYVIGFKKNDPNADKLRQEIDQALRLLKQDGTLKRIYQQWGLWNDLQKEIGIVDCS